MRRSIALALVATAICAASQAQEFTYGVTAGLNYSSPGGYRGKMGFRLGIRAGYAMQGEINECCLHATLQLASRGWADKTEYQGPEGEAMPRRSVEAYYLELPIMVRYAYHIYGNLRFFAETGPYVACGLWGSHSLDTGEKGGDMFKAGLYQRFDLGIKANVGVEISGIQLSLGWSKGIINPARGEWSDAKPKDTSFCFQVAYMFR